MPLMCAWVCNQQLVRNNGAKASGNGNNVKKDNLHGVGVRIDFGCRLLDWYPPPLSLPPPPHAVGTHVQVRGDHRRRRAPGQQDPHLRQGAGGIQGPRKEGMRIKGDGGGGDKSNKNKNCISNFDLNGWTR